MSGKLFLILLMAVIYMALTEAYPFVSYGRQFYHQPMYRSYGGTYWGYGNDDGYGDGYGWGWD